MKSASYPSCATWSAFAEAEPAAAAWGGALLQLGLAYLATVRVSAFPRIAPISPVFTGGSIWATIIPSTPKYAELVRDGRYALHALPGPQQQEFCITGCAVAATDEPTRDRLRAASAEQHVIWDDADVVFELTLHRVFWAEYERDADGALVSSRHSWLASTTTAGRG